MAGRIKADLQVLHVMTGNQSGGRPSDELVALRQLAGDVGASWNEIRGDDPAQVLIDFARREHVTQIVVGSSGRSRWQELRGGGSIVRKITRLAAPAGIDIHVIARRQEILSDQSVPSVDES